MKEKTILELVGTTTILGKQIDIYGSYENPLFLAKEVAEWIDYAKNPNGSRQVSKMLKTIEDEEKLVVRLLLPDESQARYHSFLTEDGLYEVLMQSRKPIAKDLKHGIKKYLKSIRLTGAAIEQGREQDMVEYYFKQFSDDTKFSMVKELEQKNKELSQKLDQLKEVEENYKILMDVKGTFSVNEVAHFIGIGEYKLFGMLRSLNVLFKNLNNDNVPYEKPLHKGKFKAVPAIAPDGSSHLVTRIYPKGMDYICKLLKKHGYVEVA